MPKVVQIRPLQARPGAAGLGVKVNKGIVAAALSALAVVALILLYLANRAAGDAPLMLYGNVDVREIDLAFRVGGRVHAIRFDEGEAVQAGQVVATLDDRPFRDAYATAQARLDMAQANAAKAQAGNRVQEVAQADAKLREAAAQADLAKKALDRRTGLLESGAISRRDFEETQAQYRAAAAERDYARETVALARAGARPEDRDTATAQVAGARANRNVATTAIEDTRLTAPLAGTVVTRAREIGAIVRPGETILTLAIAKPVRIRAYVDAADLPRIAPGMAVTIGATGDKRTYRGRIGQVAANAEFTPKTVQTESLRSELVYRVRILVDQAGNALRQGQPVTIEVSGARPAR